MRATQAGIHFTGAIGASFGRFGADGAPLETRAQAGERHNRNVIRLLADARGRAATGGAGILAADITDQQPGPDDQELIGLVAAVYSLSLDQAAERLAAFDPAAGARTAA